MRAWVALYLSWVWYLSLEYHSKLKRWISRKTGWHHCRDKGNKLRCVFAAVRLARMGWYFFCCTSIVCDIECLLHYNVMVHKLYRNNCERSRTMRRMTHAITNWRDDKLFYCSVFDFLPSHMSTHAHFRQKKKSASPIRLDAIAIETIKPPMNITKYGWNRTVLFDFNILWTKLWIVTIKITAFLLRCCDLFRR